MTQQRVRVIVQQLGNWWRGDMFSTSETHANSLIAQGLVEAIDVLGNPIMPPVEEHPPRLEDDLTWPDWMGKQQLAGLASAEITPAQARLMTSMELQKVRGIGPRIASALKRELDAQWSEISGQAGDEVTTSRLTRRGIAIG